MTLRSTIGWTSIVALLLGPRATNAQLSPQEAIARMARGINIGNTLEPPTEGGWNNGPLREYYFDDYKAAGFSNVRIPIRWDNHASNTAPFAVDESWMNRVEQIVDWGLERDLFVIINAHHEDWLKNNYGDPLVRARFDSIWVQIADRFRNKSEKLLFEVINEPFGLTVAQVDDLNARVLQIIRATNPTRIVVFSGNEYSGAAQLMAAAVPDDPYLMGYFHSYDPWSFAGLAEGTWGTSADRQSLSATFQSVANWSATHGVPVMISEFGSVHAADYNSRMYHFASYMEEALRHGIATQVWDDGGDFGIYLRDERDWNEVKDILINTFIDGPTLLDIEVQGDSVLSLEWTNRSTAYSSVRVERKANGEPFQQIAELAPATTQYSDTTITGGVTYFYRVIAHSELLPDMYSYPIRMRVLPTKRSCFHGSPFLIPGGFEAEDYDVGGEGLTYHDTDEANIPDSYRPGEGVDIEARDDGGFHVAYIESGEWLEYTVDVQEEGDYLITAHVASMDGGGRFRFEFDQRFTRQVTVPRTDSWQTLASVSIGSPIHLLEGEQIMRVNILAAQPFNIDRFDIEQVGSTSVADVRSEAEVEIYPNPARRELHVSYRQVVDPTKRVELFNGLGQLQTSVEFRGQDATLPLDGVGTGVYFVRVYTGDDIHVQKVVVIQ